MHKVPIGYITWWAGTILSVPSGWRLCDGNDGTPDLTDKFVVGAGNDYIVGASGGTVEHVHDFTTNLHTHRILGGTDIAAGANFSEDLPDRVDTGLTDSTNNLPPWYSLAYVMYTGPEA